MGIHSSSELRDELQVVTRGKSLPFGCLKGKGQDKWVHPGCFQYVSWWKDLKLYPFKRILRVELNLYKVYFQSRSHGQITAHTTIFSVFFRATIMGKPFPLDCSSSEFQSRTAVSCPHIIAVFFCRLAS